MFPLILLYFESPGIQIYTFVNIFWTASFCCHLCVFNKVLFWSVLSLNLCTHFRSPKYDVSAWKTFFLPVWSWRKERTGDTWDRNSQQKPGWLNGLVCPARRSAPAWFVPADYKHMTRAVYTCADTIHGSDTHQQRYLLHRHGKQGCPDRLVFCGHSRKLGKLSLFAFGCL